MVAGTGVQNALLSHWLSGESRVECVAGWRRCTAAASLCVRRRSFTPRYFQVSTPVSLQLLLLLSLKEHT